MKTKLILGLAIAMLPTLAYAHPRESGTHQRPQLIHDRSEKVHDRTPQARRHS